MGFIDEVESYMPRWNGVNYRIGMGCATIGAPADPARMDVYMQTLGAAFESGIRYFDTSAQYGGSEYRVGKFVKSVNRSELFLATKSPIPAALSAAEAAVHVFQGLRNSLERLNTDVIDLFQVHDVETLDQVLSPGGVLETLTAAKRAGKIRYFGLATRSHELSQTVIEHGGFDTVLTYSDFTPINDSARQLILSAAEKAVGVINGSPLAFGMLTGRDPSTLGRSDPDYNRTSRAASALYALSQSVGIPVTAFAMQYPLQNKAIQVTLTGPGSPQELETTIKSLQIDIEPHLWAKVVEVTGIAAA